jgi:tripartite-type tricarboxylate transporter receptor subunit TctC
MNSSRRRFLKLAMVGTALPSMSRIAAATPYPERPVRLVVPQASGGAADISARLMGRWLSERLGQPFVVENRPGAGGSIGTEAVVTSPADGHTILLAGSFNAIGATLYDRLNYDFMRDISPVAGIMRNPLIMEVSPSSPARTVAEFIAFAKANPGKVNVGSAGNGSPQHMASELFTMMTGVGLVHVPYRGAAPMLTDLLRGELHVAFDPMLSSLEHVKAGRLRALAVTTAGRSEALPDIPTVGEAVPGYESSGWVGIGVPRNTPIAIIEKLNGEINAGLADPRIRARLAELGGSPLVGSPTDFGALVAEETGRWAKVIRSASIKPD